MKKYPWIIPLRRDLIALGEEQVTSEQENEIQKKEQDSVVHSIIVIITGKNKGHSVGITLNLIPCQRTIDAYSSLFHKITLLQQEAKKPFRGHSMFYSIRKKTLSYEEALKSVRHILAEFDFVEDPSLRRENIWSFTKRENLGTKKPLSY